MTDQQGPHERLERIAHPTPEEDGIGADRLDAERDVSMLAMVGLVVVIIGFGLGVWAVTTPGFLQGPVQPVVSCEGPRDPASNERRCAVFVDGQRFTGTFEEVRRIADSRTGRPGVTRFWVGLIVTVAGVILTAIGVVRARRQPG